MFFALVFVFVFLLRICPFVLLASIIRLSICAVLVLFEICLLSALLYPSYPTYERANEGIAMHMRMRGRRYPKGGFKPLILYVLTSSFVSTVFILGLIMVLCLIVFNWDTYLYLFVLALALFVECLLNFCCGSYFLHVWLRFFFLC